MSVSNTDSHDSMMKEARTFLASSLYRDAVWRCDDLLVVVRAGTNEEFIDEVQLLRTLAGQLLINSADGTNHLTRGFSEQMRELYTAILREHKP
jgi:hypothetical protein